jgi:ankyrin repeat protein
MEYDPDLIKELVGAGHFNLPRVQAILADHPQLIHAVAPWNETVLQAASHVGNLPAVHWLLEQGAVPDLCTWAVLGNLDQVRAVVDADPTQALFRGVHGISLLTHAAFGGSLEVVSYLLDHGAAAHLSEPEGSLTPLHGAAYAGDREVVKLLLNHGASRTALDFEQCTPAQRAEQVGNTHLLDLL